MNKKLLFRILGAISSALIVVSVFVPFVSVTGYSESLWETYSTLNTLYLPIMLIAFGIIGIVFFSLNIKTEFAYSTSGAVLFFVIMQTVDVSNQGVFNTLSVGYYFLWIGAILTGLMAFLCNLKSGSSKINSITVENKVEPIPAIQKIDMPNDQNQIINEINPIQPIDVIPNPIPLNSVSDTNVIEPVINQIPEVTPVVENVQVPQNPVVFQEPIPEIEPQISQNQNMNIPVQPELPRENFNPNINDINSNNIPVNQFAERSVNPVVQDFMTNNVQSQKNEINPNFSNNTVKPLDINEQVKVNPVVQEFTNPTNQLFQTNQNVGNNNGTDIFGQPINK